MKLTGTSRRQFVRTSISSVTSAWVALRWPAILAAREHAQQQAKTDSAPEFEFFSPEQAAEVRHIRERLRDGMTRLATPDEDAALKKKSGLSTIKVRFTLDALTHLSDI